MRIFFSTMIFTLSFLFTLATPKAGPGVVAFFEGSFEQMKTLAHQEQKPYLLSFHDDGIPSRNLERFTYTSPQLANYVANNYLAMHFSLDDLDDLTAQLVDRYQVILFPTIVLFSSEGKMLYRFTGFTGDQAFTKMLETYRYKLETDMSMTFPPESFQVAAPTTAPLASATEILSIESTEFVFQDLKAETAPPSLQTDTDEFQITELQDLGNQEQLETQSEIQLVSEEKISLKTENEISISDGNSNNDTASNPSPEPAINVIPVLPTSTLIIQTGVYAEVKNAQSEKLRLQNNYSDEVHIDQLKINGQTLYRVRMGPFNTDTEATNLLKKYNTQERMNAIIKTIQD